MVSRTGNLRAEHTDRDKVGRGLRQTGAGRWTWGIISLVRICEEYEWEKAFNTLLATLGPDPKWHPEWHIGLSSWMISCFFFLSPPKKPPWACVAYPPSPPTASRELPVCKSRECEFHIDDRPSQGQNVPWVSKSSNLWTTLEIPWFCKWLLKV